MQKWLQVEFHEWGNMHALLKYTMYFQQLTEIPGKWSKKVLIITCLVTVDTGRRQ